MAKSKTTNQVNIQPMMSDRCVDDKRISKDFLELLDLNENEQQYQRFIEENSWLIPREFIQNHGIHFELAFRKIPFGNDYISDFMYLSKSSVKWHCVLIEIEKPSSLFFNADNSFHKHFAKALEQINDWRAWFSIQANANAFLSNSTGFVQTPLGDNPTEFKYVLVHGRRGEFENNDTRIRKIAAQERDDFRIMSFDSLTVDIANRPGLYVAARHSEHIKILSKRFAGEGLFGWLEPEMIKVSSELRSEMEKRRNLGSIRRAPKNTNGSKRVWALPHYLDETKK